MVRHHPGGIVETTIRLRQLATELGPDEAQVPLGTWEVETAGEPVPLFPHTDIEVTIDGLHHGEHLWCAEVCVDTQRGMVTWGRQKTM